jgi:hypothetical protein
MKRHMAGLVLLPILFLAAACGDDDDDDASDTVSPASVGAVDAAVTVTATDYKFSGLPPTAPVGTKFALQNDSTEEVHEMVMIRIPDDEDRPVGQLAALPEAEADAIFGDTEPATVIVALPGEVGQAVEGDGTVNEAGRYAVVCFIPKGAPVDVLREMFASDTEPTGPPDMGTGAPHITEGMYAEITIE